MNFKKICSILFCMILFVSILSGCSNASKEEENEESSETTSDHYEYDENDYYSDYEDENYTEINLSKETEDVSIKKAGIYVLSGKLKNGSIIVNVANDEVVRFILLDVSIYCEDSAPINIENAEKVIISLPEGSNSTISDGSQYTLDSNEEPSAAIFSKDNLTFNGTGHLHVTANYHNAIQCKDVLKMMEGEYTISAINDGIKGKDSLIIRDGTYDITCSGDGLRTTNEEEKGDMIIENGEFTINATQDGIQSVNTLTIYDGAFKIISGGGSVNAISENATPFGEHGDYDEVNEISVKGIKATNEMILYDGNYTVSAVDDAIHSGGNLTIKKGTYLLASDDDGIHSDYELTITKANITVEQSYEGLEGGTINIDDGNIHIYASDDGINAASDVSSVWQLNVNGGTIYVDANGDGVDSNGGITMNDGTLIVMGSTNDGNAALDYDTTFNMNKGTLVAVGTSGMAMSPSTTSSQNSLMIALDSTQTAQTTLYLIDSNGNVILGVSPSENYSNVVISSSMLNQNETYSIYVGGTLNDAQDNISTSASGGSELGTLTLNDVNSTYGNAGMQRGNMPGAGPR